MLGGSFSLTVKFEPNTTATEFTTLVCGYDIPTGRSRTLVHYVESPGNSLQLIGSEFPLSYRGRVSIANKTTMVISDVKFEDQGTKYYCLLEYFDPVRIRAKVVYSRKQILTSVYSK